MTSRPVARRTGAGRRECGLSAESPRLSSIPWPRRDGSTLAVPGWRAARPVTFLDLLALRAGDSTGFELTSHRRCLMMEKKAVLQQPLMTRSFHDRGSAERAYNEIEARGYKSSDIHVLMTDDTRKRLFVKGHETTNMGNQAMKGAGVGGAVGGVVGATVVGLAAAAAAVAVP